MGDRDWYRQFWLGGRVLPAVALYLLFEGGPVGGPTLVLVGWTLLIVQLEGLGNGCQRLRNSLSADAIFSSGVSSAYPMGKTLDEGELFRLGESMEEGVAESKVGDEPGPVLPVLVAGFGSLSHDPMGCRSSRSSAQTSEEIFELRVCILQEAFCVRGKEWLNFVRNSESVRS